MSARTVVLGISCFYHDSAAALVVDGVVVAAAQEERFSRIKHDSEFPRQAVAFCLKHAGLSIEQVDYVVFYEKPLLKLERLFWTFIQTWPRSYRLFLAAMFSWTKSKLWIEYLIRKELDFSGDVLYVPHHYAHAASAYYPSGFERAAVLCADGVGEWDTTTFGRAEGNTLTLTHSISFPHSLGLLYTAVTYYLGFAVNSDEYKVMGLAPYGNPDVYKGAFEKLITCATDGSYRLNMRYFAYERGLRMTSRAFNGLFGGLPRRPEEPLTQRHKDIAAALQKRLEELLLAMAAHVQQETGEKKLCFAGGVALNAVANGVLVRSNIFEEVYIQPAAGDAGGAVGAALFVAHAVLKEPRAALMPSPCLGTSYSDADIGLFLRTEAPQLYGVEKIPHTKLSEDTLCATVAKCLEGSAALGWFQGRMEFGPRALGSRSILADPRTKENWQRINKKIKFRESFRPFAPSVLAEHAQEYFDISVESPYMLLVAPVVSETIPAVTHVDNSARVQTVPKDGSRFRKLLEAWYVRTGCAVLVNTSFNTSEEPIVESPRDALRTFLTTDLDYLVLGVYLLRKADMPQKLIDAARASRTLEV